MLYVYVLLQYNDTMGAAVHCSSVNLKLVFFFPSTQTHEHSQCTLALFSVMESLWILQSWMIALICFGVLLPVLSQLWSGTHSLTLLQWLKALMADLTTAQTQTQIDTAYSPKMMVLISIMDMSVYGQVVFLCQTDVIILHWLLVLTPSFSILSPMFLITSFTQTLHDI